MNGSKHGKPRAAWPLEPGGLIGLLSQGWGEEGERILPEPCTKQAPKKKKTHQCHSGLGQTWRGQPGSREPLLGRH